MTPEDDALTELTRAVSARNALNRRRFLTVAGSAVLMSLGACGGTDTKTPSKQLQQGTIKLGGYPDWIGKHEIPRFERENPSSAIKQVAIAVDQDRIAKLATDPSAVDIMLLIESEVQRVIDLGVAAKVDLARVPNYRNIDRQFRIGQASDANARAVTTDYGKTGFAYRKDIVHEKLTSWADVWKVAPKYSGKITFLDFPLYAIGAALLKAGASISSTEEAMVREAADQVIKIKPHLKSFVDTDLSKGLIDGSVAIAMDWDYDIYLAQQQNKNIVWVAPEEGIQSYLDVWVPISTSERLPVVWKFFDFHFESTNYADFVNTLGVAFCMGKARRYIDKPIAESSILYPPESELQRVVYQKPLGKAEKIWDAQWQRIKAA